MVAIAHEMKDFAARLSELANSASSFKMFEGETMAEIGMAMTADLGGFSLISEDFDGEEKLMRRSTFQFSYYRSTFTLCLPTFHIPSIKYTCLRSSPEDTGEAQYWCGPAF